MSAMTVETIEAIRFSNDINAPTRETVSALCDLALSALRSVPPGEPVAWMRKSMFSSGYANVTTAEPDIADDWRKEGLVVTPLYASPPPAQEESLLARIAKIARAGNTAWESNNDTRAQALQDIAILAAQPDDAVCAECGASFDSHSVGKTRRARIYCSMTCADKAHPDMARPAAPSQEGKEAHSLAPNETDTLLLDAFTPQHYAGDYPPYINLTMLRLAGDVVLTVRAPTSFGKPAGATSSVRFNRELWAEFVSSVERADKRFKAADYIDSISL